MKNTPFTTGQLRVGGSDAVTHTQKFQIAVIFAGMATAFVILLRHMPEDISLGEALTVAGGLGPLGQVAAQQRAHRL